MRVGLREANQNFSRLIRAVRQGTEIVLTERGRPIARLTPIAAGLIKHKESVEALLRRLEAEGLVRRAAKSGPLPSFKPLRIPGPPLSQTIGDLRDER